MNTCNKLWRSSYEKNNFGSLLYLLIRLYRPEKVVELGTKAGYSTYHIAKALKDNKKGSLDCYDLWEQYPFHSVPQKEAEENLQEFKEIIHFNLENAIGVDKKYKTIDILHVDLSNDGILLEKIVPYWIDITRQILIMEGGSKERDGVEWMKKYHKQSIKKWLTDFKRKRGDIEYVTVELFPSITIIRKISNNT